MHGLTITKLRNTLVSDVVFHACLRVDGKFNPFVDWASESAVILTGIQIVGIVLRVV